MKTGLILGRKPEIVARIAAEIDMEGVRLLAGTNIDEVRAVFDAHRVDTVIMGAGLAIADRLEIIRYVFEVSKSTTVHMKDWDSGPAGMLPFVENALAGISGK